MLEARRGWDSYDEYLVGRARDCGLTAEEVSDLSQLYKVSRTIAEGSYQRLAEIANKTLRRPVASREDAAALYAGFLTDVAPFGAQDKRSGNRRMPWIFAAKLLWFYQPASWVMFDNLSQRAIHWLLPPDQRGLAKQDFARAVRLVFPDDAVEAAAHLARAFGVDNPYPLRIIDKYLYLRGGRMETGQ